MQGKDYSVLATLNRTQSELSSTIKKIFKCDDHMGIAVSGVTADGRIMCKFIRGECLNHRCACDVPVLCMASLALEVGHRHSEDHTPRMSLLNGECEMQVCL